jgi:short-chain fatty acids transporter
MLAALGRWASRQAARTIPDPLLLALWLTLGVAVWATLSHMGAGRSVSEALQRTQAAFFQGFSSGPGLAFALQMSLVLLTGQAFALSPWIDRALGRLAALPRTMHQAVVLVTLVAFLSGVLHWGLGALAGAIVAQRIGARARRSGFPVHYPLLGAAAYTGFAVFHGGFSGSAPLKVSEPGHFLADALGVLPLSQTLLSPVNLSIMATLLVAFPLVYRAMVPPAGEWEGAPALDEAPVPPSTLRVEGVLFGWLPLVALVGGLVAGGVRFDINTFSLLFLLAGLAGHGSVTAYAAAIARSASTVAPIAVQYPFYFALSAMMADAGLIAALSGWMMAMASPSTLPVVAVWSAALLNLLIPSGGGQWAVQGPLLAEAGLPLGVDPALLVMAFAHGDAATNLLQPFWALPLLGLMGLRAHQIIGYCAVACAMMLTVVSVWVFVWAGVGAPL